ncbi:MAG: ABC transporter ATP-binding protein [Candidatus Marinimicrobia bacterium]|nr:ABC transporter ATP-binding protein [Candidatus Neomarinimicrobiota bacterium]
MIDMNNIKKVYDTGKIQVEALRGVNLQIEEGDFMTVVGPSGSGKSTLMNIIGCLDKPSEGEYKLNQKSVKNFNDNQLSEIRNQDIGFVFQNFNLLPYASAYENVEMPLLFAGMSGKKRRERVEYILDRVGLSERMGHKPNELSGGQKQRVAIARALVNNPKIILADEPTGNLDTKTGENIMQLFIELWKEGNTIVMITHDPRATKYSEKAVKLIDGKIKNQTMD